MSNQRPLNASEVLDLLDDTDRELALILYIEQLLLIFRQAIHMLPPEEAVETIAHIIDQYDGGLAAPKNVTLN